MVEFGPCRLDVATRRLWRDGELVHLEPKAFDVLAFLVEERDRVVPNGEILDAVWGDRFVSESALTTRIKEIRRAVGDDGGRQSVVANVRGRGYRFVAPVRAGTLNVPATASSLVGRDADVAEVRARLQPGALVTVVGPGGVGKTTLARAVCRSLERPPADGVIVVELAEVADGSAVVAAVAAAAEVVADERDVALLARTLASLDAVLLLDNCEHVVTEAARLVRRLLEASGPLRILATSRERIGVAGELVWPLLPLGRTDAVELFLRRARAAVPSFSATGSEADLEAVLSALDDLPLAIEMAAARVSSASLAELRAEVEADPAGLRAPDRGSPLRHRTLADVVSWSVDRLGDDERRLFTDLSAFAGPVRLDDVQRMVGDRAPVGARLAELVDRSLVVAEPAEGGTRFRLLETVRVVAAGGAGADVAARHAGWVVEVAGECDAALRTPQEPGAVARLGELVAELRAAVRWAAPHDPGLAASLLRSVHQHAYWRLWPEPSGWARDLLAREPEVDEEALAVASLVVAGDAANRGRLPEARRFAERASARAAPRTRAAALEVLADVALYESRYGDVPAIVAAQRALGEELGDVHVVAMALVNGGLASVYGGRPADADEALHELADLRPQLAPSDAAWATYVDAERVPPEEAAGLLAGVLATASAVENHLLVSVAQDSLGAALCRTGRLEEAAAVLESCLAGFLRHAHYAQIDPAIRNTVELLERLGARGEAATLAAGLARLPAPAAADGRDAHRDLLLEVQAALRAHRPG